MSTAIIVAVVLLVGVLLGIVIGVHIAGTAALRKTGRHRGSDQLDALKADLVRHVELAVARSTDRIGVQVAAELRALEPARPISAQVFSPAPAAGQSGPEVTS